MTFRMLLGAEKLEADDTMMFEYAGISTVRRLSPERGAQAGGTLVRVEGSGFGGDEVQCRFGTHIVAGRGANLVSSTLVHCIAPFSGSLGEVNVDVSMNGGADFTGYGK